MPDNNKDNIFLKCNFYTKENKNEKYSKHRDFVSCNSSYNYVSYVDGGANEKVQKDYAEYVGNEEKSCGIFGEKGLLSTEQKQRLKERLKTTDSVIWDMVISFRTEFGEKYCRDYEQAFSFVKSELPRFFKRCGLNPDNIIWYAGLHENTENKHIHISFFEKEPIYFDNGGKLKFHSGTLPKKILIDSKMRFERKLTNATAKIIQARKDLIENYDTNITKEEFTIIGKKKLLQLYRQLPKDGRIAYDSENMADLKDDVDKLTKFFLNRNKKNLEAYHEMILQIDIDGKWRNEREYNQACGYLDDLYRRLGNKTIETALKVGKINDQIESIKTYDRSQKIYKKQKRKDLMDEILDLMEYNSRIEEYEIAAFKRYLQKLHENSQDFEM